MVFTEGTYKAEEETEVDDDDVSGFVCSCRNKE
jgi:hypothetical protein